MFLMLSIIPIIFADIPSSDKSHWRTLFCSSESSSLSDKKRAKMRCIQNIRIFCTCYFCGFFWHILKSVCILAALCQCTHVFLIRMRYMYTILLDTGEFSSIHLFVGILERWKDWSDNSHTTFRCQTIFLFVCVFVLLAAGLISCHW